MGSTDIDITGIDKVELLTALWLNSKPAAFYTFNYQVDVPGFSKQEAKEAVKKYIDYFCGRCIKMDLSGDTTDVYSYERDFGKGSVAGIVAELRSQRRDTTDVQ
jgi:hypothetical protein